MTPHLHSGEHGAALIVTMMVVLMLAAMGRGLITLSDTEAALAHNHRAAGEVRYAADAALERALTELAAIGSWTSVLNGSARCVQLVRRFVVR